MTKKLDCILLIDDDNDCNFFHRRIIEKMGCCEKVEVALNGKDALNFLNTKINNQYPCPDIIFLDINMPVMNGWDFLNEYQKLGELVKAKVIIMLTTSLNPDDRERALGIKYVAGFENKYLTKASLERILNEHFQDSFSAAAL